MDEVNFYYRVRSRAFTPKDPWLYLVYINMYTRYRNMWNMFMEIYIYVTTNYVLYYLYITILLYICIYLYIYILYIYPYIYLLILYIYKYISFFHFIFTITCVSGNKQSVLLLQSSLTGKTWNLLGKWIGERKLKRRLDFGKRCFWWNSVDITVLMIMLL